VLEGGTFRFHHKGELSGLPTKPCSSLFNISSYSFFTFSIKSSGTNSLQIICGKGYSLSIIIILIYNKHH
jgi:hypothetical protein